MATSTLKLGYWPYGGLCQPIRMLLHLLKADYENIIYSVEDDSHWQEAKKKLTQEGSHLLNLPYLQDGETIISESAAIPHYLCHKFNRADLFGKTNLDTTRLLELNSALYDLYKAMMAATFSKTKDPKDHLEEFLKEDGKAGNLIRRLAAYL